MARHPRRKFNLRRVRVNSFITVGALASGDVTEGSITASVSNPLRIMSANLTYALTDLGAAIDDGQEFGLSHGDYTAAEVEEALEASAGINLNDKIGNEQANRLVRVIGTLVGDPVADGSKTFNDGRPKKTKLNWYIGIGQTLALWIRNSSDTVWTTGAGLSVTGDLWVKDSI